MLNIQDQELLRAKMCPKFFCPATTKKNRRMEAGNVADPDLPEKKRSVEKQTVK